MQWIEADVEELLLRDATVDVALAAFGVIFHTPAGGGFVRAAPRG